MALYRKFKPGLLIADYGRFEARMRPDHNGYAQLAAYFQLFADPMLERDLYVVRANYKPINGAAVGAIRGSAASETLVWTVKQTYSLNVFIERLVERGSPDHPRFPVFHAFQGCCALLNRAVRERLSQQGKPYHAKDWLAAREAAIERLAAANAAHPPIGLYVPYDAFGADDCD